MSTWWKVGAWRTAVEPVEVERETDKCVYVKYAARVARENKVTEWGRFFSTWAEAADYLHTRAVGRVESAKSQLRSAEEELEAARAILGAGEPAETP